MKKWMFWAVAVVLAVVVTFTVMHKVSPLSWGMWGEYNASSEIGNHGYDPVAYFTDNQATIGSADFTHNYGGVTWQFANADNRELFAATPQSYAPQYGGFCSFAVSKGFTADVSPEAWYIQDNKLYLFADQKVRDQWVAAIGEGSLKDSDAKWAKR